MTVEVRLQEGHSPSNVPSEDISPFECERETETHQSPIAVVVGNIVEEFTGELKILAMNYRGLHNFSYYYKKKNK